jgi:outer membrane receptor protein involved in Fe transport
MNRASVLIFGLLFFLTSITAMAQSAGSTSARITGAITDQQDAVIVNALVTATNTDTNFTREALSIGDGSYLISQLTPGKYRVSVTAEGFATKTLSLSLELGNTALLNFVMQPSATAETVEIQAGSLLNADQTESSINVNRLRIDTLPINRRDFLSFSVTSARVLPDRVPAEGSLATSGLSFNGQSGRFNNITIDGLGNNDYVSGSVSSTFSQDAVREFQVVVDSFSAEFGRAIGGIANIVTRSGSNEFHGNLFLLNRNEEISARDPFSAEKPPLSQYQFGAVLGGPIKRDRLFFFSSFERLSVKQSSIVTAQDETVNAAARRGFIFRNGPIPFSIGTTSVLSRLDAQLTPNNTFWLRYNGGFTYNGGFDPFRGLVTETAGSLQRLDDNAIAANDLYINSRLNLVNEARFLYSRRNQDVLPLGAGPQNLLVAPEGLVTFGRTPTLPELREERTYQFVDNVTINRGHNQIKFGVDFAFIDSPNSLLSLGLGGAAFFTQIDFSGVTGIPNLPTFSGLQTFDPSLRTPQQRAFLSLAANLLPTVFPGFPKNLPLADLAIPAVVFQSFGNGRGDSNTKLFSLFAQDDIRLRPNLTLKLGLRYDLNRATFLPDNNGNVSPRFAISYRPGRLSGLNLRASYGIFFGVPLTGTLASSQITANQLKILALPFPFSVIPYSMPGNTFPESEQVPQGFTSTPQLTITSATQPDLRNSYSQQLNTGFDYVIAKNSKLSLTYVFLRGLKLFGTRDINPVVRPVPGNPTAGLLTGRVDPTRGTVLEFESAFDSYYHAFTIGYEQRILNRIDLLASYTLSKAIDNILDIRADVVDQPANSLRPGDERALSFQDARHRFVFSGTYDLSYTKNIFLRDFQLSAILNLNTGRPYNLITGNLGVNLLPGSRPAGLGRNVGMTPGFANLDMRLMRSVVLKDKYRIQGIAEVFNLFNRVNVNNFDRVFIPDASGTFILPPKENGHFTLPPDRFRSAFSPRQFQLGFRFLF